MKANKKQRDNGMRVFLFGLLLASALMLLQAVTIWNKAGMMLFGISTLIMLIACAKNDIDDTNCEDSNTNSK